MRRYEQSWDLSNGWLLYISSVGAPKDPSGLLLERFDHSRCDLVGDGGAESRVKRIRELEAYAEVHLRRARLLLPTRPYSPPRYQALDGALAPVPAPICRRDSGIAADRLHRVPRDAEQAAREGLLKAAKTYAQVRLDRPAAARRVAGRPVRDLRGGAVGHEVGVRVDVGDELVEARVRVRKGPGRGDDLRLRRGEKEGPS